MHTTFPVKQVNIGNSFMSRIVFSAEQSYIEHIKILTGYNDDMHANKYGVCITCKKCVARKLDAFRCLICDEYEHVGCSKLPLTPVEVTKRQVFVSNICARDANSTLSLSKEPSSRTNCSPMPLQTLRVT